MFLQCEENILSQRSLMNVKVELTELGNSTTLSYTFTPLSKLPIQSELAQMNNHASATMNFSKILSKSKVYLSSIKMKSFPLSCDPQEGAMKNSALSSGFPVADTPVADTLTRNRRKSV